MPARGPRAVTINSTRRRFNRLRLIGLATRAGLRLEAFRRVLTALDEGNTVVLKTEHEAVEKFVCQRQATLRQFARELNWACESPQDFGATIASKQA